MLRGISPIISPDLLKTLAEMGHGDEIVFTDAHYPQSGCADRVLRADGLGIPALLKATLNLMPLDQYNDWQYGLMETVGDDPTPTIWPEYAKLTQAVYPGATPEMFERFAFYEHAKKAYATVITGETAQYGNIILKKGVLKDE